MFKQKATPMFNNNLFKTVTILRMRKERKFHDSTTRLYKAALEMKSITGQSAVARLLNQSPQTVKNWEVRGVSKEGALLAERMIGCNALWILTGQGFMENLEPEASTGLQAKEEPIKPFPSTAPPWPFQTITAREYERLTDEERERVERFIRFELFEAKQKKGRPNKITACGQQANS